MGCLPSRRSHLGRWVAYSPGAHNLRGWQMGCLSSRRAHPYRRWACPALSDGDSPHVSGLDMEVYLHGLDCDAGFCTCLRIRTTDSDVFM